MADEPLEDLLVEMLSVPVSVQTIGTIQTGAVRALVNLYDRKVTRDEFCVMAAPLIELHTQSAKLWILHNIHAVYVEGDLDETRFKEAHDGLTKLITAGVERAIEIVKKTRECAQPGDAIN